ncbi:MAG TPA: M15 family metallopeptidase [Xanthobacteraceae bacterium]|nr:M15 family metallopeptidase [Xanthobacteraceae bacterium]
MPKFWQMITLLSALAAPAIASQRTAMLIDAGTVVPGLITDIRYAGSHNFVGRPIDGYRAPRCLLTQSAANALAEVARDLATRGLVIKAFDCYRPVRAVADFVRWARDPRDQAAKPEFYPDVDKRTLFRDGYIASHSGHSRGSTVDLTLARADGAELDMGTPFDFFSPRSGAAASSVTAEQHANRMRLAAAMQRRGFRANPKEWWHFTLRNEPFPDSYFDMPVQ